MTQASNKEELKMLLFSFLSSLDNETIDIILNVDDALYSIILQLIEENNLKAHIILCLSSQFRHYSMNLSQLEEVIAFLFV